MALLVGFSMFAFIVADSINATNIPIFLGAFLGSLALWLLSGKGGTEGWLIAGVGALLGAVVGMYGPGLFGGNTAVMTAQGELSQSDVNRISREQQIANEFLSQVARLVYEDLPEEQQQQYEGPEPFGFLNVVDTASQLENATLTFLFEKEADTLGITLTDAAIQKYIADIAQNKMTNDDFRRIRTQMQIGTGDLLSTLRTQLRAREAFHLLVPRSGPTPQQLWTDFRKLSVEAETLVAAIPAEAFLDEVDDPSASEIVSFFEQYKAVPPGEAGTPGFRVPRQVQVAYLELEMDAIRKSVEPPTDAEVRAYYDQNRSQFDFQHGAAPGTAPSDPMGTAPADDTTGESPSDATPVEAPRPQSTDAPPEDTPATEPPTENAPTEGTPAEEAPAEEPSAGEPSADESPTESSEESPEAESPDTATPASEPAEPAESPSGEESSSIRRRDTEFVAFQEEDDTPASEATDPPADPAPASESAPAEDAAEGDTPPGSVTPPELPAPSAPAETPSEPSQAILDSIREDLLNQKVREAADARLEAILEDVRSIIMRAEEAIPLPDNPQDAEQQARYEQQRRESVKTVAEQLQEYAENHEDVNYRATPYLSANELYESEDYPIGSAVRWERNAPVFGRDTTPIVDQIFRSPPDQPLQPIPAQNLLDETRYIALKIADVEPRVPTLDEEGVREKVVREWKLQQGRELAAERAAALAARVEGDETLASVLEGETITGSDEGRPLTARNIGPFTWLRRTTPPGQGFQLPNILPNELPQLPGAGEEFMKTVFETLAVGQTGAVASADGSTWYVVEVQSRSSGDELAEMREGFLKENPFFFLSPFRMRMSQEAMELRQTWFEEFKRKHDVVYPDLLAELAG